MSEFDVGLPSIRLIQSFIKDKTEVELKLIGGEVLEGLILWQDPDCFYFNDEGEKSTLIWRQAVAYIKPID
ncbi:MAG: RNA-binding protein hfq [Prochloraceae cyanobacterium]|nr:RNA-binding protein hfq [Prochloraceae cyanobacterium]